MPISFYRPTSGGTGGGTPTDLSNYVTFPTHLTTSGYIVSLINSVSGGMPAPTGDYAILVANGGAWSTTENSPISIGSLIFANDSTTQTTAGVSPAQLNSVSGIVVSQIPDVSSFLTENDLTVFSGGLVTEILDNRDVATQDWVTNNFITEQLITTISGDIIQEITSGGSVTNYTLTTVSGDIVSQIPNVSNFVTIEELISASGNLATQIINNDGVTLETLTTVSGDIVTNILNSPSVVTQEFLTTVSGNITSQIPSLTGYATTNWVDNNFIDTNEITAYVTLVGLQTDYYNKNDINTLSGALVSQISEGSGDVTTQTLITTSGDIVAQIPSLVGYATQSWTTNSFVSNSEITTISNSIVSQIVTYTGAQIPTGQGVSGAMLYTDGADWLVTTSGFTLTQGDESFELIISSQVNTEAANLASDGLSFYNSEIPSSYSYFGLDVINLMEDSDQTSNLQTSNSISLLASDSSVSFTPSYLTISGGANSLIMDYSSITIDDGDSLVITADGITFPDGSVQNTSSTDYGFIGEALSTLDSFIPVYQTASGTYGVATCDDENKADVMAIVGSSTISGGETGTLYIHGKITNDSWSWEYGKNIYLSTSGTFAQDIPTISGHVAKPLGVVISPTTMFFNPQVGWIIEEDV